VNEELNLVDIQIEQLVDVSLLRRILDSVINATGIEVSIMKGDWSFLAGSGKHGRTFCEKYVRKTPKGIETCMWCDLNAADQLILSLQAEEDGVMQYECFLGLIEIIAPVIVAGKSIAYLIGGRAKYKQFDEEKLRKIAKEELGCSDDEIEEFVREAMNIPIVNSENIKTARNLVSVAKDTISQIAESEHRRTILDKIVHALNEAENLNDVIELAVVTANYLTEGNNASLLMWDAERDILAPRVREGIDYYEIPPDKGITRRALRTGIVQLVSDVSKNPDYFETKPETRSELSVPLIHKDRVIGVLDVQSDLLNNFTEGHERLLRTLGNHISAALEKMRRIEGAEVLYRVQSNLSKAIGLENRVQLLMKEYADLTGGSNVWIRLLDKQRKKLIIAYVLKGIIDFFPDIEIDEGILKNGIDIRKAYICNDISQDSGYPGPFKKGTDLTVPIILEDELNGIISVWSPQTYAFNQEDLRLLNEVSYLAGLTIERAAWLKTISDTISQIGKLDEERFLNYLITTAIQAIFKPYSHCTIWFYNEKKKCLYHRDVGIPSNPFVDYPELPLTSVSGQAIEENNAIPVPDISENIRYHFKDVAQLGGFKSMLSIPITIGNRILGVFNVHTFEKHAFSNWEISLLTAFAKFAAVAIDISGMIEKLASEDQAKTELISVFAHELITPLTPIMFYINRWQKSENLPKEYRDQAALLYEYFKRQERLIDKVTNFSRMKKGFTIKTNKEKLILNDVLQSVVEEYKLFAEEEEISLHYEEAPENISIYADWDMMIHVFGNLVDNAIKYTPEGGLVRIDVEDNGDKVNVAISDTGIGISQDAQKHIFEEFYSGDESQRLKGGMGIGLYIVSKIINEYDGEITFESEQGKESTFTVTLPKGVRNERKTS